MRMLFLGLFFVGACSGGVSDNGIVPINKDGGTTPKKDGGADDDAGLVDTDAGVGDMTMTGPVCVPAAQENCLNDVDDDCNGIVNNGCADSLGISNARDVDPYVGADNNANAVDQTAMCPANSFVTTLSIYFLDAQQQVSGLRLGCSSVTLSKSTTGYTASLVPITPTPSASLFAAPPANSTGDPIVLTCSGTGLRGLFADNGSYDAGGMLGFFGRCGTTPVTLAADNTLGFAMMPTSGTAKPAGTTGTDGYTGYDYGVGAGLNHTDVNWTCNANEVVIGYSGRVSSSGQVSVGVPGAALDKVQPICGTLTPHYIQ